MSSYDPQVPSSDVDSDLTCPYYQNSYSPSVSPRSRHSPVIPELDERRPSGFYAFIMDRLIGNGPDAENFRLVDQWVRDEHQRCALVECEPNSPEDLASTDQGQSESENAFALRRLEQVRSLHSEGKRVQLQLQQSTRHFSDFQFADSGRERSERRQSLSRGRSESRRPHATSRPRFTHFRHQRRSVLRLSPENTGNDGFLGLSPIPRDQDTYVENVRAAVDYIRDLVLPVNDAWRRRNAIDEAGFVEAQTRSLFDTGSVLSETSSDSSDDDLSEGFQNVHQSTVLPRDFTRSFRDIDFDDPRAAVCVACDDSLLEQPVVIRGCGHLYCKKCTDCETPCPVAHCGSSCRTFRDIFLV